CNTGSNLAAIRAGGSGDVTQSGVLWMAQDGLPDIISPLCDCQLVYLVTSEGLITCFDVTNGKLVWEHDLMKPVRSSPTLVGKRIFLTDQEGVTHFFEAGRTFKDLGSAVLGEPVETTPAFLGGRMFLRGEKHLYCIGD
ncbi:MAG: PQQ-binding-like beta-propeller repeat protein, partial [Armatimonadota bacterium]|nr:PQQ-binding-like beta-propeller repeat protein [Armatimonadota bacterium]